MVGVLVDFVTGVVIIGVMILCAVVGVLSMDVLLMGEWC